MRVLILAIALILCGCSETSRVEPPFNGSCVGYGCEWRSRSNAVVSYARVVYVDGRLLRQDLELILDDGRIFAIYDYYDRTAYRIGDRVRIEYGGRRARKIEKIGDIYEDWQYLYDY